MPYFVFRITEGPTKIIKNLEHLETFDAYKEAKNHAKKLRKEQNTDIPANIKVMFADNLLAAEEQLQEDREESITKEWEK